MGAFMVCFPVLKSSTDPYGVGPEVDSILRMILITVIVNENDNHLNEGGHTVNLTLKGLSVRVGDRLLVKDVSLAVTSGEAVALVGASGSGKSLTAAAITGSLPGSATADGQLDIQGHRVSLNRRARQGVVGVLQDSLTALHPLVRIDRQLIPVLLRSGLAATRVTAASHVASMLEEVGFSDPRRILQSFPMELSGGQRQRVCIVQALACRASFLIADEPTTALDVLSQQLVLSALRKTVDAGTGILLITHDVAAAAALCTRAVVIDDGLVVDQGSFAYLAGSTAHPDARALMRSARETAACESISAA